jgi:hypothetical protein
MISKIAVPMFALAAMTVAQSSWAQNAVPPASSSPAPAAAASSGTTPAPAANAPLHFAPGTVLPVELDKSIDSKKAHQGDPVIAKIDQDLLSNGKIVVPRNSKVVGHVAEAKASSHDDKSSTLGIAFDKIVVKDGPEVPLNASVQGIGAPISANGNNGYGGDMGSPGQANPSGTNGSSPMGGSGNAGASPSGSAMGGSSGMGGGGGNTSAGMPNGPQDTMPTGQRSTPLARTFQGVSGLKGLSLSQGQMQDSVITSQDHNVKLDTGTQILLRTK